MLLQRKSNKYFYILVSNESIVDVSPTQMLPSFHKKHVSYIVSDWWRTATNDPILVTVESVWGSFYVVAMYGKLPLPLPSF